MGRRVDPIREVGDIEKIKEKLYDTPRNLALFVVGINVALRAIDLLSIKVGHIRGLKPGDYFFLKERKTGKRRSVIINEASHDAISRYLSTKTRLNDEHALFLSRKGWGEAITTDRLNIMVKEWCEDLKGDYGSHSLRKTWGYHQRVRFKTDTPTLMRAFNHSSETQTLTYLGVEAKDVHAAFMNTL